MMLSYSFWVRVQGVPTPGRALTWWAWKRVKDGGNVPPPPIADLGKGLYGFGWDAKLGQDCTGIIDAGADLVDGYERFIEVGSTREAGAVLGLPGA